MVEAHVDGRSSAGRSPARLAAALLGLWLCLAMAGCGEDGRKPIFSTTPDHRDDAQSQAIQAEIAQLANGKKAASDADASKAYDEAKTKLIARGSAIESQLFEALAGNPDWGIRLGCVEVLQSVGTRHAVEPLIAALDDPDAVIALYAQNLLIELCKHREIPAAGQPTGANGLPAVPKREPTDLALDTDEKLWTAWHRQHHAELRQAWQKWWAANKDKVKID
jgi:hypothetical protein